MRRGTSIVLPAFFFGGLVQIIVAGLEISRGNLFGATMSGVTKVGGWVVLVFAVLAWYHAAGDVIAATFGRKILPVGPPPVRTAHAARAGEVVSS
jgi:succinate-acetate transporter protein